MLIRTNVTGIGDPFILNVNGEYYMYATCFDANGFKVRKSFDLCSWDEIGVCLDLNNSKWAYKDFWAPEVIHYKDKFIMHFTSRNKENNSLRIGVAISDNPEGPFIQIKDEPMFDFGYATIDGHVFIDDNNKKYLYYSKDCSENYKEDNKRVSEICVIELNDDLLSVKGEPIVLFGPTEEYESMTRNNVFWNEGPYILKKDNKYYLTYSANFFASKEYCICLAISNNPLGPFVKNNEPILSYKNYENDFSGPGHNAFFINNNNELMMTFHIHTDENKPSSNRKACIINADIKDDTIKFY